MNCPTYAATNCSRTQSSGRILSPWAVRECLLPLKCTQFRSELSTDLLTLALRLRPRGWKQSNAAALTCPRRLTTRCLVRRALRTSFCFPRRDSRQTTNRSEHSCGLEDCLQVHPPTGELSGNTIREQKFTNPGFLLKGACVHVQTRPFTLAKWYLDCVTDEGDAAIVYCTEMNWRGVHIRLCSILSGIGGNFRTRTSIFPYQLNVADRQISVELPKLGVAGTWKSDSFPFERVVYEQGAGNVRWNCLQPRSIAQVCIENRVLRGPGYAESLTLSIMPWELPLKHLRWGRFVSPQDSLAWVDWQGSFSTRFAIYDSRECALLSVSDAEVAVPNATLHIEPGIPLRSGRLGETFLTDVPALGKLFPQSLFNVVERKWLSRATLTATDHISAGWVIHEVVHWKA